LERRNEVSRKKYKEELNQHRWQYAEVERQRLAAAFAQCSVEDQKEIVRRLIDNTRLSKIKLTFLYNGDRSQGLPRHLGLPTNIRQLDKNMFGQSFTGKQRAEAEAWALAVMRAGFQVDCNGMGGPDYHWNDGSYWIDPSYDIPPRNVR
jgi:hypothetical protein